MDDFAAFYEATFPDLAGYAWSLTREGSTADELAQEALTRVYVRWRLLREPRAYAFRVVTNLARDAWRAAAKERATLGLLPTPETTRDLDVDTLDAVRRLPERLRDVVLLHYWADLSIAEVARATRRPEGTVKRRLHEARAALSATLTNEVPS